MSKVLSWPGDDVKRDHAEKASAHIELLDPKAQGCMLELSRRTRIPLKEITSYAVTEWYEIVANSPASFFRREIAKRKRNVS